MLLEKMSISKLAWNLVPIYSEKINARQVSDITRANRFVVPSDISQRNYALVEKFFFDYLDQVDFVELSPLQPLGVNHVLANTNGKQAIPTIRGPEVISDATTALFMETYRRYSCTDDTEKRLATHVRTVRPQMFDKESRFLPHFKVFAETSVGKQLPPFGSMEIAAILNHLIDELAILDSICNNLPNSIVCINVYISNQIFAREIAKRWPDNTESIHLMNSAKKAWREMEMPKHLSLDSELMGKLRELGFGKGLKIMEMFLAEFGDRAFVSPRINYIFDLSRTEGIGYYKHIAYKVTAVREDGLELPLADGGSNDWGTKVSHNKQLYTVSSGIGTELLIKNFLELA